MTGCLVFDNVKFAYPHEPSHVVLSGLSLTVKPNTFVALVGPSGGGKSTMTALLERFYDPTSGAVLLDGVDLRDIDPRWLRQQIGYVEQSPRMFTGSIAENIRYGCPTATDDEVVLAAQQANVRKP